MAYDDMQEDDQPLGQSARKTLASGLTQTAAPPVKGLGYAADKIGSAVNAALPGTPQAAPGLTPSAGDAAAPAAPSPLDTSKFNTKGYAVPQYVGAAGSSVPAGYDAAKWNDPNYQSPKYAVGRILNESGPPSIESIQKALPHLQQAYGPENVKFNGKDKISIDGGKTYVDVLTNAGSGQNMGWAWQDEASQAGAPAGVGASGIPGNPLDALMGNGDVLAQILAALGKSAQGA